MHRGVSLVVLKLPVRKQVQVIVKLREGNGGAQSNDSCSESLTAILHTEKGSLDSVLHHMSPPVTS